MASPIYQVSRRSKNSVKWETQKSRRGFRVWMRRFFSEVRGPKRWEVWNSKVGRCVSILESGESKY